MTPDDLERSLAACHRLFSPPAPSPSSPRRAPLSPSLSLSLSSAAQQPPPLLGPVGGDQARLLSTTTILEAADQATAAPAAPAQGAAAAAPPRLVSIQEIRRLRTMAAAAAPPPQNPPTPSSSSPASPDITTLAARVRDRLTLASAPTGPPAPITAITASELLRGCRFLQATPEELRLSDVGALLAEHRALASLAADLARLLGGNGGW